LEYVILGDVNRNKLSTKIHPGILKATDAGKRIGKEYAALSPIHFLYIGIRSCVVLRGSFQRPFNFFGFLFPWHGF